MNGEDINAQMVMQLASSRATRPWICSVYFVIHTRNFYWLSFPERRHSRELTDNTNAAIGVVLRTDQPVVGIQAEGDVYVVEDQSEVEAVMRQYVEKYDQGMSFVELFRAGKNKHLLYCFVPRKVMVFDEGGGSNGMGREVIIT
jgi:uncharacterized protein YhbP (UPF0306 family)